MNILLIYTFIPLGTQTTPMYRDIGVQCDMGYSLPRCSTPIQDDSFDHGGISIDESDASIYESPQLERPASELVIFV